MGFVETDTENERVLTSFLRSLVERGLDISQGVLVILDGSKGLRAAVRKAFRHRAVVHRCQWHKRENVVSHLAKREQASWRQRLQRACNRPEYDEARPALERLHRELEDRNQSAAGSLQEGFDETLTLHRLGPYGVLGRSLKTTNCLESVNALVEERCAKVDHWQNSSQRHRWLATALLDIEPRLRKLLKGEVLGRLPGGGGGHGTTVTEAGDVFVAQISGGVQKFVKQRVLSLRSWSTVSTARGGPWLAASVGVLGSDASASGGNSCF